MSKRFALEMAGHLEQLSQGKPSVRPNLPDFGNSKQEDSTNTLNGAGAIRIGPAL